MKKYIGYFLAGTAIYFGFAGLGYAETTVSAEVQYIFNTILFLMSGFLVMWMAAGFAMLESGLVTSKVCISNLCKKYRSLFNRWSNVLVGWLQFSLRYSRRWIYWTFTPWSDASKLETGYSDGSDWFFQMVFCATTMSIVSGTLAERIKIWPFFLFAAILTGIIYPISMGWQWGGGWLSVAGFSDFAGSTLVHAAGGAAALAGAIVLGARSGRFSSSRGEAKPMAPFAASSIPLATLGVFILWLGWFGFNGGSQLAAGTLEDVSSVATIYINTNLAAAGGVLTAATVSRLIGGKTDVVMMLNGAIAGLVAITAEPLTPSPLAAIFIGAIGGLVMYFSTKLLLK
jgi:Amt family ammonium transporter